MHNNEGIEKTYKKSGKCKMVISELNGFQWIVQIISTCTMTVICY